MASRNRRLPRGQSWPLTLTDVVDGLGDAYPLVKPPRFEAGSMTDVVLVTSWVPDLSFNYGSGGYHPETVGIHLSIHPVRSQDRLTARSLLRAHGLPQLREWLHQTTRATETWKTDQHYGYWRYVDNGLPFSGDRPE
jgi:hypothetical protein